MMFNDLAKAISALHAGDHPPVVVTSGFGGAGKTTLTNRLRDYFGVRDGQVIRLDNLFAPQSRWGNDLYGDYDWELDTGRGFQGETLHFNEPLPKVVFIEGMRLIRPELMRYFDYSVWVDCPVELATERGKVRDRADGADEAHIARWDTEWVPRDQKYFDLVHPEKLADFVYREAKEGIA